MKKALITGITGQDGSYLAECLLGKGYGVYGMVRRASLQRFDRLQHILYQVENIEGDLTDQSSLDDAIKAIAPDEVYNLASQSFVPTSLNQPVLTAESPRWRDADAGGGADCRAPRSVLPGASSEMFGKVQQMPQTERTPFYPRRPYGVAKVYGHWITVNYRESYDIFACSGICFNHESPRRGRSSSAAKSPMGWHASSSASPTS